MRILLELVCFKIWSCCPSHAGCGHSLFPQLLVRFEISLPWRPWNLVTQIKGKNNALFLEHKFLHRRERACLYSIEVDSTCESRAVERGSV